MVAGTEVPIVWRGRHLHAFVPVLLADRDLSLGTRTVERTATAVADVLHGAADLPADYEPLARLLLRAEGVASSFIEGVTAPMVDIVLAEAAPDGTPAAWVASNLAAVSDAVAGAQDGLLSVERLCGWHETLMTGSPTPARYVGALRREQGWIGGTSPVDAALVTPPPDAVPQLVEDVVAFSNADDIDPIAQAAIAHAQFEVIHPFADGNGRVGRVLVHWVLARRLKLVVPPPVSTRLAADVGGYLAGLVRFRLGEHEPWIQWFATAVSGAGRAQEALVRRVEELRGEWLARLGAPRAGRTLRQDSSAWAILNLLPRHLVLTTEIVAAETGQSTRSASTALGRLVEAGVLTAYGTAAPQGRGRPAQLYVSSELLGLTGATPTQQT